MQRHFIFLITLTAFALGIGLAGATLAAEHTVLTDNFVFTPADLTIEVGDTVTWVNVAGLHNVWAPGRFRCANGCDGQGGDGNPATNNWEFSLTFNSVEMIDYVCEVHEGIGMVGTVNVVESAGLTLSAVGACPGPMTIEVTGGTPNKKAFLLFSRLAGTDPIPVGGCAGTPTGLSEPSPLAPITLDGSGAGSLGVTAPPGACGVLIQALDVASCDISGVVTIGG